MTRKWLLAALAALSIGCGGEKAPSEAVPTEVKLSWPDAAPLPTAPVKKATGTSTPETPETPETAAPSRP